MSKKIIFLTGAAGTGKSTVIEEMKQMYPDYAYRASITRQFYASKEIMNEKDFMDRLDESDRMDFQFELFEYYIEHTIQYIIDQDRLENSASVIVIDRSPIDHLAYTINASPSMSHSQYRYLLSRIDRFFRHLFNLKYQVYVYAFPYPTPWIQDSYSSDGFRFDPFGKNYLISVLIRYEISQWIQRNKNYDVFRYAPLYVDERESTESKTYYTPKERATFIMNSFMSR